MKLSTQKLRQEYSSKPLSEEDIDPHPLTQFVRWIEEAIAAQVFEPNGMTLSTVSELGRPSSRSVLLKQLDERGFIFFTNYKSRKGEQLKENPYASLTFWWKEIYRQVTIEGKVKKTSRKESEDYFAMRPRAAQLAALASHQSAPLSSREELEEIYFRLEKKYSDHVPCPKNWGGYILAPERIEFWQGQKDRLHDRFLFVKIEGEWTLSRLFP